LTGAQLKWIYNMVTTKNPMQLRFPFALWTRAMIRTLVQRKSGIKLSVISVGRLLAQMGLSCQKPLSRADKIADRVHFEDRAKGDDGRRRHLLDDQWAVEPRARSKGVAMPDRCFDLAGACAATPYALLAEWRPSN
jgi:hypothetical protein